MGRPYSLDLRERAVAAVEDEGMSRQAAAARFGVAASTVINWVRQFRDKGHGKPGRMGGHKPKAISGEHREWLLTRCRASDFTLRGLVGELAEQRGLKVDYRSVWEFVHAEDLSYKKNPSARRARSSRRQKKARAMGELSEAG
jgi:transposase